MLYIRFPVIPGVFNLFFGVNLFNALLNCVFRSCLLYTFIASEIYYKMTKEEAPPQREAAISKQVRIKDVCLSKFIIHWDWNSIVLGRLPKKVQMGRLPKKVQIHSLSPDEFPVSKRKVLTKEGSLVSVSFLKVSPQKL
jgi:hypothetical protein